MKFYIRVPVDRQITETTPAAELLAAATEQAVRTMRHKGVAGNLKLIKTAADHFTFVVTPREDTDASTE